MSQFDGERDGSRLMLDAQMSAQFNRMKKFGLYGNNTTISQLITLSRGEDSQGAFGSESAQEIREKYYKDWSAEDFQMLLDRLGGISDEWKMKILEMGGTLTSVEKYKEELRSARVLKVIERTMRDWIGDERGRDTTASDSQEFEFVREFFMTILDQINGVGDVKDLDKKYSIFETKDFLLLLEYLIINGKGFRKVFDELSPDKRPDIEVWI